MSISLENWIRNKLQENEEMHDYAVATDAVRVWIDEWKLESKMNFTTNGVIVITNPYQLNARLIRKALTLGNMGMAIDMGDAISVEPRKSDTQKCILDDFQYMKDNIIPIPLEIDMPIKNYDIPMPIVKQAPKFPPEEPKPHPTSWRQSNRHFKRRK
jgi:hypothetical protein